MRTALSLGALTLALLVIFGIAVEAQNRGMGRLNGSVVSDTGEPIDGVVVKAPLPGGGAIEGKSSPKGLWAIGGIGKGEWVVEFGKPGFEAKRLKVIVEKEVMQSEPIKVVLRKTN